MASWAGRNEKGRCSDEQRPFKPSGQATADLGDRGVLSAGLRGAAGEALLFALEVRFLHPGALQVVLHVDVQAAEALDFQFDLVAILEGMEPAVVRAEGGDGGTASRRIRLAG